jgi:hypothetical protein
MANQIKPTSKNSPAIKVGNNKNILPAEKYAMPHDMSGNPVSGGLPAESTETGAEFLNNANIGAGTTTKGNYPATKTDGITMRGYGAATKGIKSRGPMA